MKHEHVTTRCISKTVLAALAALFFTAGYEYAAGVTGVQFEAESGVVGANLDVVHLDGALGVGNGEVVVGTAANPGSSPVTADNVVTYTVDFPEAGEYDLYIRYFLDGSGTGDSILVAEDFGTPDLADAGLWALQNSIDVGGKTNNMPVVDGGVGSSYANSLIWVNFSAVFTGPVSGDEDIPTYTVAAPGPQTFQLSQREPGGIMWDAVAFVLVSEAGETTVNAEGSLNINANLATNPSPADGEEFVSKDADLSWGAPDDPNVPVTYDVYFGSTVPDANCDGPALVSAGQAATTYDPGTMAFSTTYYWRVDVIDPNNGSPFTVHGLCWSFTTAPEFPVILGDPQGLTVDKGATAVFTVDQVGGNSFQWKKGGVNLSNGGKVSGATSATLTITDVQLAEEGDYSVMVSNSNGSATSAEANLLTCRLVGHWKLDGDLTDSVQTTEELPGSGSTNPGATAHDGVVSAGAIFPAAYATGADGTTNGAYDFAANDPNSNVIVVTGDQNDFNFWTRGFTVSFWSKDELNPPSPFEGFVAKQLQSAGGAGSGWAAYHDNSEEFEVNIPGVTNFDTNLDSRDGTYHMYTAVYDPDGQTLTLYLDGIEIRQATGLSGTPTTDSAPVIFGADAIESLQAQRASDAEMDDVRIYSCPLKPTEVAYLYTDFTPANDYLCVLDNPEDDVAGFDFNADCTVNLLDYAIMAQVFEDCYRIPASLCD